MSRRPGAVRHKGPAPARLPLRRWTGLSREASEDGSSSHCWLAGAWLPDECACSCLKQLRGHSVLVEWMPEAEVARSLVQENGRSEPGLGRWIVALPRLRDNRGRNARSAFQETTSEQVARVGAKTPTKKKRVGTNCMNPWAAPPDRHDVCFSPQHSSVWRLVGIKGAAPPPIGLPRCDLHVGGARSGVHAVQIAGMGRPRSACRTQAASRRSCALFRRAPTGRRTWADACAAARRALAATAGPFARRL